MNVVKVTLLSFKAESEYTFVDFIRGGYVVVPPVFCCESEKASWDNVKCFNAEGLWCCFTLMVSVFHLHPGRNSISLWPSTSQHLMVGQFHCSVGAAAPTKCLNGFGHLLLLKSITYVRTLISNSSMRVMRVKRAIYRSSLLKWTAYRHKWSSKATLAAGASQDIKHSVHTGHCNGQLLKCCSIFWPEI